MLLVYLAVGGVVGTLARYTLTTWVQSWTGEAFPWGTMLVNLSGSFLLGVFVRGADLSSLSPEMRALLTVGICGAFTTFSTFTLETARLLQDGAWARAVAYAVGSVVLGLVALAAGLTMASALWRTT